MAYIKTYNQYRGMGTVELLVGVFIMSVSFLAISLVIRTTLVLSNENKKNIQASFLLEECIEVLKTVRNGGWTTNISTLSVGTPYSFYFNSPTNAWVITPALQTVGDHTRSFVLEDVYRDVNNDISAAGTLDSDTKKIIATVSWPSQGTTKSISLASYITNLHDN